MNNNLSIIQETVKSYNLTPEQYNEITARYQNDTRDINQLKQDLTSTCDYYAFQNRLLSSISALQYGHFFISINF